mgnify:CR=1 FL=1
MKELTDGIVEQIKFGQKNVSMSRKQSCLERYPKAFCMLFGQKNKIWDNKIGCGWAAIFFSSSDTFPIA